jgi:hypothetical protein
LRIDRPVRAFAVAFCGVRLTNGFLCLRRGRRATLFNNWLSTPPPGLAIVVRGLSIVLLGLPIVLRSLSIVLRSLSIILRSLSIILRSLLSILWILLSILAGQGNG